MSDGFSVRPGVVRDAATDLSVLADSVLRARDAASTHIHVSGGGTFLNRIAESANAVREQVVADYGEGGTAYRVFDDAGAALRQIAADYRETDTAEARRYDGLLDVDPVDAPEYLGGRPGIDAADYAFVSDVEDAFEGFNDLDRFSQDVEYVVGLDWISSWLTAAGIVDPFAGFREALEGDWRDLGTVLGAMRNLQRFWEQADADLLSVPARFTGNWIDVPPDVPGGDFYQRNSDYGGAPNWSGNACDATVAWLKDVAREAFDHAYAIELRATAIQLQLQAAYQAMDLVLDTVEDLIEIVPWGQSVDDFLKDLLLPWRNAERLLQIAGLAAKLLTRVRGLMTAVEVAIGVFSELIAAVHELSFPDVAYPAPDVNG